jgi:hypothetical protein
MNTYQRKPCSFPAHQLHRKERMEKSAKYNGMTFSHYCRFLDELHWETLTPEVKEAIKLTRL